MHPTLLLLFPLFTSLTQSHPTNTEYPRNGNLSTGAKCTTNNDCQTKSCKTNPAFNNELQCFPTYLYAASYSNTHCSQSTVSQNCASLCSNTDTFCTVECMPNRNVCAKVLEGQD